MCGAFFDAPQAYLIRSAASKTTKYGRTLLRRRESVSLNSLAVIGADVAQVCNRPHHLRLAINESFADRQRRQTHPPPAQVASRETMRTCFLRAQLIARNRSPPPPPPTTNVARANLDKHAILFLAEKSSRFRRETGATLEDALSLSLSFSRTRFERIPFELQIRVAAIAGRFGDKRRIGRRGRRCGSRRQVAACSRREPSFRIFERILQLRATLRPPTWRHLAARPLKTGLPPSLAAN